MIVLVVSITRVVSKCVQAIKAVIWERLQQMRDDPGPLQLNSRVRQKRLASEYGTQWGKKKKQDYII